MGLDAVIFDWGGTLSVWADVDMEDMWRLAAEHLAPERAEELLQVLCQVEARSFARVRTDRRSLYDDVWGAGQAGMRAVWVRNSATPPFDVAPDAVIDDLTELPGVLAGWADGKLTRMS